MPRPSAPVAFVQALAFSLALVACAPSLHVAVDSQAPRGMAADAASRAAVPLAPNAVLDRLYFGRSIPGGGTVSEDDWRAFLRDQVTPRFPEGSTSWRAEGQWRDASGAIVREESYVLELVHDDSAARDRDVRDIVAAYRERFRQESVMRVTQRVRASF